MRRARRGLKPRRRRLCSVTGLRVRSVPSTSGDTRKEPAGTRRRTPQLSISARQRPRTGVVSRGPWAGRGGGLRQGSRACRGLGRSDGPATQSTPPPRHPGALRDSRFDHAHGALHATGSSGTQAATTPAVFGDWTTGPLGSIDIRRHAQGTHWHEASKPPTLDQRSPTASDGVVSRGPWAGRARVAAGASRVPRIVGAEGVISVRGNDLRRRGDGAKSAGDWASPRAGRPRSRAALPPGTGAAGTRAYRPPRPAPARTAA